MISKFCNSSTDKMDNSVIFVKLQNNDYRDKFSDDKTEGKMKNWRVTTVGSFSVRSNEKGLLRRTRNRKNNTDEDSPSYN